MSTEPKPNSFAEQMTKIIADVENGGTLDDSRMAQVEFCSALNTLLWNYWQSHQTMAPSKYAGLTADALTGAFNQSLRLARLGLDVLAGRMEHEILDKEKAKRLLMHKADGADMLVRLVGHKSAQPSDRAEE